MATTDNDRTWYKDAVIYEVHIRAFKDTNGDGSGDIPGLIEKLPYLEDLGVTALWILPFYPSPLLDDGYDISDYYSIHPRYGTMADFEAFLAAAHARKIRVITELVIGHTSDQHDWFRRARSAPPHSPERDYYVWSDTADRFPDARILVRDFEKSNWAWDQTAKSYYWHRFAAHQPALNHNNPKVVEEVERIIRFWFDKGVDGMRLDAIPFLCVREGTNCENLPETHAVIKRLRRVVDERYPGKMFLAEANQWPEDLVQYFGDGDECHMAFHFPLMPRLYMALQQESREPITEILGRTPDIPDDCQWAVFLRNHDELTLEMVTDKERDYLFSQYGEDPQMRVNYGIRRRLAPLVKNSRRRIELLNSILLSFQGTPVIYYGDEIAMGDNVYLGDRNAVRTPMQWSNDKNAGFSGADASSLFLPLIQEPIYHYNHLNVETQRKNPTSLLNFMRLLIAARKKFKAFAQGETELILNDNDAVLSYVRFLEDEYVLCVVNLSRFVQPVLLDMEDYLGWRVREALGGAVFPNIETEDYFLALGPHSFYWFILRAGREVVTPPEVKV